MTASPVVQALTGDEWERRLGAGIRDLRLRLDLTQAELARRAGIDRTTVNRIEQGGGGSIRSLVQIARALDREEWLLALAPPPPAVSPMAMLRLRQDEEIRRSRRSAGS